MVMVRLVSNVGYISFNPLLEILLLRQREDYASIQDVDFQSSS